MVVNLEDKKNVPIATLLPMKTTFPILLVVTTAVALTSCDQAKETATEAAAKTKAVAVEASAKAEAAMPGLKEKASAAMDAARAAGSEALDKTKEMAGAAKDWTKEKLGIPEADGLLDGFHGLFAEARQAVNTGMNSEKASALRAKWDALYASSTEKMKTLAPEQQEKLKALIGVIKTKWDELLEKSKNGAVE